MRTVFKVVVFFLTVAVVGCSIGTDEPPTLVVGQDFTNTNVRVISIDSFTVALSTMKFDSIATSDTRRLLVGQFSDDAFGVTTASTYFELTGSDFDIDDDAILDSVGLILGYDNYFYSDTTLISSISVHRITDEVDPEEFEFFNTSRLPFETTPLASMDYSPTPNRDSLYIPLPMDFGTELFNKIVDNDIDDVESFVHELRGLTVQPGANDNSSIIGFLTTAENTYLRFFYRIPDEFDDNENNLDFTINTFGAKYFNSIQSDVSNLSLDQITDQEFNLASTQSSNFGHVQSGVGYATRIEFPTIKNIFQIEGEGTVLEAILQIKPNRSSYSDIQPVKDSLSLNIVDLNNEVTLQIANSLDFVYAVLVEENAEFNEIVYNVPVIEFVDRKINESPETEDALILLPLDFNSSVNKMLLNDQFNTDFEAKLILTYAIYDED
ncbi:MAG: DUF4270 family protein [Bacteroidota bacterium]